MRLSASGALLAVVGSFQQTSAKRSGLVCPAGGSLWRSTDGLRVISSIGVMELPGGDGKVGPTWLVSVSRPPGRCSLEDMMRVVAGFAMPAFDEDNHHPGVARMLFCPIDERYRNACECKTTELQLTDEDGYQWTTDVNGECRGCTYERMIAGFGRQQPCPIHKAVAS